jgi:ATP-binding cassette, subfamily C, bacterial
MQFSTRQQVGAHSSLRGRIPGRAALLWAIILSVSINALVLVLPFYCIQIFDRVITSGSIETLVGLTIFAVGGLVFSALFEAIRGRLLTRFAVQFERFVGPLVLEASIVSPERGGESGTHGLVKVRELRNFLSSGMVAALIDAPFLPAFLIILYFIHPWFGIVATVGTFSLLVLALISGRLARAEIAQASGAAVRTQALLDSVIKHAGLVRAMGWTRGAIREFLRLNDRALAPVVRGTERVAVVASVGRTVRLIMQVAALGGGAWLVVQNELLAGSMIAGSIIISRTLQPVENLLTAWRALTSAHDAWNHVNMTASTFLVRRRRTLLPPPAGALELNRVIYRIQAAKRPILAGVNFASKPGEIVVVIGPTGAGKSTLLRLIAGLERPTSGTIQLDRASLEHWNPDQLGQFVGYLPQDVALLGGTVAEAIAGFDEHASDESIIAAAILANAHDMILSLPQGYETEIGCDGSKLSGGQRQRIGLARAFYGHRKLILLDEPNSNLDPEGEEALCSAVRQGQTQGATFVIVTHRPRLLTIADSVLFLRDGIQVGFGDPSGVLPRTITGATPMQRPRPSISGNDHRKLSMIGGVNA